MEKTKLIKRARPHGNSGGVPVPKSWIGKLVEVKIIKEK